MHLFQVIGQMEVSGVPGVIHRLSSGWSMCLAPVVGFSWEHEWVS